MSVRMTCVLASWLAIAAGIVLAVSLHRSSAARPRSGIVSLSPALSNLLFQLGAGDKVIGVSQFSSLPPGQHRPIVGDFVSVNGEVIRWLGPRTIVYQSESFPNMRWYEDEGISLARVPINTLDDLRAAIRRLVGLAGQGDAEAAISHLNGELDGVRAKVRGRIRPRVLLVCRAPVGRSNFLNELMEIAGGENVVDIPGYPPILNDEQITALWPQVIIDVTDTPGDDRAEQIAERLVGWQRLKNVPAVTGGRVYVLADPSITIPDLNVGRTARELARRIHPDAFGGEAPASQPAGENLRAMTQGDRGKDHE